MLKQPPQDIKAEESLLAGILIDNDVFDDINLEPEEFYKPAHQTIFRAIQELTLAGTPVDLVILIDNLKRSGKLEAVGGAAYISRIIDTVPITTNAEYHAQIIRDNSNLRKLITVSSGVVNECFDISKNALEILDASQIAVMEIGNDQKKSTHIRDILQDTIVELEELSKSGNPLSGIATGHTLIDRHTAGLQKSHLIILAGRPSMGKTALVLNWIRNFGFWCRPGLFFSIEMSKNEVTNRLLSDIANVNGAKFRNGLFSPEEWHDINRAAGSLADMPIHILDEQGLTVGRIASIARKYMRLYKIEWIVIDYLQLIEGWTTEGQGPKAEITRSLKKLARTLKVPVVVLSQLNRGLESRQNKRPIMSDLRDSGAIEQDADIVAFIYRDEVYNTDENNVNKGKAEIIFGKNRGGGIGTVPLAFIKQYTRFENLQNCFSEARYK